MAALTRDDARAQREHELASRRAAEHACALDFLVYGDGEEPLDLLGLGVTRVKHADRCVFGHGAACSRTYDPMPYDEAEPVDLKMYEGTSIGALYGITPDVDARMWFDDDGVAVFVERPLMQLEGWTVAPRSVYE